jgi:hypothetical protein
MSPLAQFAECFLGVTLEQALAVRELAERSSRATEKPRETLSRRSSN